MTDFNYGFETTLPNTTFDDALDKVAAALKTEGFGVLTKIDVKETLKKKLDADFRPYTILGACNPVLAKQALEFDAHIGLLLPCNVVVQQADSGEVSVSILAPSAMFGVIGDSSLDPVAKDAEARLRRVLAALER